MEPDQNAIPDASALLRSLNAYLPSSELQQQQQQYQQSSQYYSDQSHYQAQHVPHDNAWPPYQVQNPYQQQHYGQYPESRYTSGYPHPRHQEESPKHASQGPRAQVPSAKPVADPRTIITWPSALRYVSHRAANDDDFLPRICGMIKNQHDHERQWWDGREALVKQQGARAGGKKELDDVLTMIGVSASKSGGVEDEKAELALYDTKVHKAQMQMVKHMTQELRDVGVPFFGTRDRLIAEGPDRVEGKLTVKEMESFQKQILSFLEEMCKE